MRIILPILVFTVISGCMDAPESNQSIENPFFNELNVAIDYANVSAGDIEEYAKQTLTNCASSLDKIKKSESRSFEEIFIPFDQLTSDLSKASSICWMMYWVSPDSLSRIKGLEGNKLLDSLSITISTDKALFEKVLEFSKSDAFNQLSATRKKFVEDIMLDFNHSGVSLKEEDLTTFKKLVSEILELSSDYSTNMNTANEILVLDQESAEGISDKFLEKYKNAEGKFEIPVMPATRLPVLNNANKEETRQAYHAKYYTRGADKNLQILDELIKKRYQIGKIMGFETYASYNLSEKMAKNSETVWDFIYDLISRSKEKAKIELEKLKKVRNSDSNEEDIAPWNISFYQNEILINEYQVDHEKIREFLPMKQCLEGMFLLYQELLGLEFRKVENPSVWHEEVEMYEVYEGNELRGQFYLDLFPRPNKESWFYGVPLTSGRETGQGYEVPVSMLLGNFTRPTDNLPSLLSHKELSTLFHEFGHIMDKMSYTGEFAYQSGSKADFVEAMSQIFENWIWDYDIVNSFASHYETGEPLPKETFENMIEAKNVSSGLNGILSLRACIYDMTLYDKYDPENPFSTDEIWTSIDEELGLGSFEAEGTHTQACWIHINTHPVYYYGYLWSKVYAQDMFTQFEENGMRDRNTGIRYREIILANGTQWDMVEAVEEFLGRPSNNEAYIKSLGLKN